MASNFTGDDAPRSAGDEVTGRYLVLGRQPHDSSLPKMLRDRAGLTLAGASDFPRGTVDMGRFGGADGVYLEHLGIAIAASTAGQIAPLAGPAGAGDVIAVEPERVLYLFHVPGHEPAWMAVPAHSGFATLDSLGDLVCSVAALPAISTPGEIDERARTWGLVSTRVLESSRTGRGVRVAVLDTGFDANHPDFAGRSIVSHSFVEGQTTHDGHGHGTHCIGTALGPAQPRTPPRYGIASDAEIFVGKIMANNGRGTDGTLLAGINWAVTNRCRVASMSVGKAVQQGQAASQVFEAAAQRALAQNTLIIAAGGNESDRRNNAFSPVGHPANCPSIMAVGAVDAEMRMANFSVRGMDGGGGAIDIVGPGVNVYSSAPQPENHKRMSGTSMACPHVAGIAALYAEAHPNAGARELWQMLVQHAKRLSLEPSDMGAGLVQAPR